MEPQALNNLKLQIPPFYGSSDPEEFLAWMAKTERIIDMMGYNDATALKLVVIEFHDYALTWWEQEHYARARDRGRPITTFDELKRAMRNRFVPRYYDRDCAKKLQRLVQSHRSVEDYQKDLERALMRANVKEDNEAKLARFLYGLREDIAKTVEHCDYRDYQDLVHKAIRVEKQLKKGNSYHLVNTHIRGSGSRTTPIAKSTLSKPYLLRSP